MGSWNYPYDNTGVTVELREIVESGVDVWKFEYPSYYTGDEKKAFEQKVLDHYWLRQIGQETVGRWLHYFRSRMREIMPYYIQLYQSQALMQGIEDPFGNVDIVESFEQETTGASTVENIGESTSEFEQRNDYETRTTRKFSNTPQGEISNIDDFLTEATQETAGTTDDINKDETVTTEATSTGTERSTTKHTYTKKGNQGVNTYAHDMKELRETFLNIDLMIIRELNDLFLQVY